MSQRLIKKMYNDEQGLRKLAFYSTATPTVPLVAFDLNVLEDLKISIGEEELAIQIGKVLNVILEGTLTAEELEWAVEDI